MCIYVYHFDVSCLYVSLVELLNVSVLCLWIIWAISVSVMSEFCWFGCDKTAIYSMDVLDCNDPLLWVDGCFVYIICFYMFKCKRYMTAQRFVTHTYMSERHQLPLYSYPGFINFTQQMIYPNGFNE